MNLRRVWTKAKASILVEEQAGIHLDLGCGPNKQPGFLGMDKRALPGVDLVWDIEEMPWPLPGECAKLTIASHIIEHVKPWLIIDLFDEVWRVTQWEGQLAISMPYGTSGGWMQDPTHCAVFTEATLYYFDPRHPLYQVYEPRPWKLESVALMIEGNLEAVFRKIKGFTLETAKDGYGELAERFGLAPADSVTLVEDERAPSVTRRHLAADVFTQGEGGQDA